MIQEIKQRITQLNNGEIPSGYKKTDFGVFPCEWVTDKTFGDLFDFFGGLSKSRKELGDKGIPYLHYGDMHRGTFSIVSYEQYKKLPKYDVDLQGNESYLMSDGDIAFLDASEDLLGTSRAVMIDNPENKPFAAGLHIILAKEKTKTLNKQYKQYLTLPQYMEKQFQRLASGFKVYGLNRSTLTRIKIAFSDSQDEQSRIAEILMKWDEAVNLQEQMIEALQKQKKYYLSKMFPSKDHSIPEIRFNGFTDAWELRKFGDMADYKKGPFGSALKKEIFIPKSDDSVKVYEQQNAINKNWKLERYFITKSYAKKLNAFETHSGDILISCAGTIGEMYELPDESESGIINQALMRVRVNEKVVSKKLYKLLFNHMIEDFSKEYSNGSAIKNISPFADLKPMTAMVPSVEEQFQLSGFFANLDNLITLHQRKLEKMQEHKKAMMQLLLTGLVRVVK